MTDQAHTLRSLNTGQPAPAILADGRVAGVYSITSGKGGVGKTAVVANIAVALGRLGKKVLILDADLGLANIDVVFGLAPLYNLNHFFSGERDLAAIMVEGPGGLKILPAGSGVQSFITLDTAQKLRLIEGLDALHDAFDYVLIDTEAGISENVTYFNSAAQEIILVTTPEPTSITDAYALMKLMSTRYHEHHFNLVVNMVQNENEALEVYKKLTKVANRYLDVAIDYLGSIPADRQMNDSIRRQRAIVELYPHSKVAQAFTGLAARLCSEMHPALPKGNIQFFWKKLLRLGSEPR